MDKTQLPNGSQNSDPISGENKRDGGDWDTNRGDRVDLVDTFLFMDAVGIMVLNIRQASALSLGKKSQDVQRKC